jgi:hypothetical protein
MTPGALIVSDLAHVLLLVALLAALGRKLASDRFGRRRGMWVGFALGAGLSLLPGEWNPAFYSRAIVGDPGALGWVLLLNWLSWTVRERSLLSPRELRFLAMAALAGAILIYPASLGVPGAPDFYRSDFGGFALPTAMMGLGLICLWRGFFVAAAAVISGLLLYGLDLHESANLWDCVIDFPSVVVSVVILVKGAIQRHHRPSFGDVQAGGGG